MTSYVNRTIVKEEVNSERLGITRSCKVYLPPGYNELLSYPVIYCQDGNEFFTMGRIATIANQLILEDDIEPMIIVGVSVERSKRTSEYSPTGSRNDMYKRFFVEELLPYIEDRYPVRKDISSRVIAGDSLGGTVSLHLALDHPEVFQRMISLSGAFFQPTLDRIQETDNLSWLKLWMVVGTEETEVETNIGTFDFVDWNRRAKLLLEEKQAHLHYSEQPGRHVWGLWQNQLPDAIRYFFA
ncbi:alpha/beta hydrolase [Brevibacillus sp. SYSU BS000544]|uniref:alpha/beta hydrolase n=1 Tax=Brevibacillus sp. SYSU BS000544 TaxID=3416443 RepID=UPI003CE5B142